MSGDLNDSNNNTTPAQQAYWTFTAPATGTYFLRFAPLNTNSRTGGYTIRTWLGTSGAERGRDQRDAFVTWSENAGGTWATPVRVNSGPVGYDDWLPEIAVAGDGCPYVLWFDWRDDPWGSRSYPYLARSTDAGATWAQAPLTDVQNNWTTIASNIVPNQGDYHGAFGTDSLLRLAWADGREGTADVWTAQEGMRHLVGNCPADMQATAGDTIPIAFDLGTANFLFGSTVTYSLSDDFGWTLPSGGPFGLATDIIITVEEQIIIPDSSQVGQNNVCINVANERGIVQRCCFEVDVAAGQQVAVGSPPPEFALHPGAPNPARGPVGLGYSLPARGHACLRIYGVRGELVRTLVDAVQEAGPHRAAWDGRDARGRAVAAGVYFYRLEASGRSAVRRVVLLP
jgi:hypothetical protein